MKKAFTLAEVLITLTIIGVIAAITIPNLMQNYKKYHIEVGVKEAYSILSNAMKMSVAENGEPDDWVYSGSGDFAKKYVVQYLKTDYICDTKKPCFDNNGWTLPDGTSMNGTVGGYGSSYFYKMKLHNGMDFGVWAPSSRAGYGSVTSICFLVDVDGGQGKSIVGKDVFAFSYVDYSKSGNPKTGTLRAGSCLTNSNDKGYYNYTNLIFKNSWKIPEDYPIKKF